MKKDNLHTYNSLRNKYKELTFESFNCSFDEQWMQINFHFILQPNIEFKPSVTIPLKSIWGNRLSTNNINSLAFHIGMVELISYWKCACPSRIVIKPYTLDEAQVLFWKKLYYNGLGEFFYINSIEVSFAEFVNIFSQSEKIAPQLSSIEFDNNKVLVPVGGGKDSVVTLELLKGHFNIIPFVVNPIKASQNILEIAGYDIAGIFEVHRTIDPTLVELNNQGYLNGHTPFSALLAFVSLLASSLTGARHIALSNESSANEPTIKSGANHQYSKSFEFETDFRDYYQKYLHPQINYFSLLRPLNEYRIAGLFSKYSQYFRVFKSCNVGGRMGIWCGQCPKCLFTFIILSPHINRPELEQIFGYNLFDNPDFKQNLKELSGLSEEKPFECVGTTDEVNAALWATIEKYDNDLPILLKWFKHETQRPSFETSLIPVVRAFDGRHHLNSSFLHLLKSALHDG